jgi:hypothetical protein
MARDRSSLFAFYTDGGMPPVMANNQDPHRVINDSEEEVVRETL